MLVGDGGISIPTAREYFKNSREKSIVNYNLSIYFKLIYEKKYVNNQFENLKKIYYFTLKIDVFWGFTQEKNTKKNKMNLLMIVS